MSLDAAIKQLEEEVASFKQGTKAQPREGSQEWFILRARMGGLQLLRRMQREGHANNPRAAELLHRRLSREMKLGDPDGTPAEAGG